MTAPVPPAMPPAPGSLRARIPRLLCLSRLFLAPPVLALAFLPERYAPLFLWAFLSDVYDGVLARRWGVATPALRRLDSACDKVFYLAVLAALFLKRFDALLPLWPFVAGILAFEAGRALFDKGKYGRAASYHLYSAKLWGIALFVGCLASLGFDGGPAWLWPAVVLGLWENLEGLLVSLILPTWQHDVPTLAHAWRRRHLSESAHPEGEE